MVKNLEIRLCIRSAYGTKKGLPVKSRKPLILLVELRRFERPTPSVRAIANLEITVLSKLVSITRKIHS